MYSVDEIREKVAPIARAHRLRAVYLFGSYARGDADENSDIDLLYDRTGSLITSLLKASSMYADLKEQFDVPVDLVSADSLESEQCKRVSFIFLNNLQKEKVKIYDREGDTDPL